MTVHACATAIESLSVGGLLLYSSWIGLFLHKVAARSFSALSHCFIFLVRSFLMYSGWKL